MVSAAISGVGTFFWLNFAWISGKANYYSVTLNISLSGCAHSSGRVIQYLMWWSVIHFFQRGSSQSVLIECRLRSAIISSTRSWVVVPNESVHIGIKKRIIEAIREFPSSSCVSHVCFHAYWWAAGRFVDWDVPERVQSWIDRSCERCYLDATPFLRTWTVLRFLPCFRPFPWCAAWVCCSAQPF